MCQSRATLLIFTRAPRPGQVKTRLVPALGEGGACALHQRMVEHTLATARATPGVRPELHCAPACDDPWLNGIARRYGADCFAQQGADLGERMAHAARTALSRARRVVLLGTDAPAIQPSNLLELVQALEKGEQAAMIPAEDGGYVALGLGAFLPEVFRGIAWGGPLVAAQTREVLQDAGRRWCEFDALWDVDRPADLARLSGLKGWSGLGQ